MTQCYHIKNITIESKNAIENYTTFEEKKYQYLPNIPGLMDNDGLRFNLCLDCGKIIGMDLQQLISKLELIKLWENKSPQERRKILDSKLTNVYKVKKIN